MNAIDNKTKRKDFVVALNSHIDNGLPLLKPHEGSIKKEENARFIADLFLAALRSDEYRELGSSKKVVIVTDNAPAQSGIDELAFKVLAEDGIVNLNRLAILRLGPK
ncbi:Transposase [Phytophthora palmivora]|uniref:Transposase n=1 Tax=Phytophthora palmivora TaxID=4796 RepID=A0A2P4XV01_9STRA|nr:Transposase [Phytophthora palmivora]